MLSLKHITKTFKKDFYTKKFVALDDVSFSIKEGSMLGFLGANGAGKTTTLKIILDFIKADSGQIEFSNEIRDKLSFFKNLGYMPERPYFHANLTGREFVQYMAKLNDVKENDVQKRLQAWSERLKIDHALDRKLANYSKGMLQRIGFVSCLIHEPKFLILDEPVSGLDPIGRREIKDVMLEINKEGKTIFFSSHIVSDVEEICESLIVLDKGKVLYDGSVEELLTRNEAGRFNSIIVGKNISESFSGFELEKISENKFSINEDISKKSHFLKICLEKDIQILSMKDVRPSLEEIVYGNIKKSP